MENTIVDPIEIEKPNISIIGFGNFGKFMAKHLLKKAEVIVTDVVDRTLEAQSVGLRFASLEDALQNKIIILAMPMGTLEATLENIKNKLKPGTLVLDVCSLKIFACEAMKRILRDNVEIIGTHPLFGPQSAPKSIEGMRIALVNVRAKKETFIRIKNFCESLGLNTIVTTAEEHDRQMALSQALTHFIGQVLKRNNISRVEMSTLTFDKLMAVADIIKNDSPALFNNMQTMNPFAQEARNNFVNSAMELNAQLNFSESGRK